MINIECIIQTIYLYIYTRLSENVDRVKGAIASGS